MKQALALVLLVFGIVGCATYSPEQLQAKASDKSDFDLCFDMVLPNPSQFSKQELMNREVDCSNPKIATPVLEKRRKQIALGQALMAFGNSIKTNAPVNTPSINSLPNYSSRGTMYMKESETIAGFNKICVYSFGATKTTRTIGATDLCPLSVTE